MADSQVQPPLRRAPRGRAWDRGPLVLVDNLVKPGPLSAVRSGRVINRKYFCSRGLDVLDDRLQPGDLLKRDGFVASPSVRMLLLMIVDYVVRTVRNSFSARRGGGVDSDLSLADKLFAQVLDLQYKSRNGTVGALANTLKEFEHIREFFASATLVSLIDVPFAFIFLAAIYLVGGYMVVPVIVGILVMLAVTTCPMKALAIV